jgi:hypothetical protein
MAPRHTFRWHNSAILDVLHLASHRPFCLNPQHHGICFCPKRVSTAGRSLTLPLTGSRVEKAAASASPIVQTMCEPRRLTALRASTASYRDSVAFYYCVIFTGPHAPTAENQVPLFEKHCFRQMNVLPATERTGPLMSCLLSAFTACGLTAFYCNVTFLNE